MKNQIYFSIIFLKSQENLNRISIFSINRHSTKLVFILSLLFFSSCLEKEKPISAHTPGNINTVQIAMEFPYKNQVFYNCEQNKIISTNNRFEWDLAFQSNGKHIKLNIAKAMFAFNMGAVDFYSINNLNNVNWLWDNANGNLDSLALNDWILNPNNVFIIDRGFDNDGNHFAYYKAIFQEENISEFTFKFAKLDGTEEQTFTIIKDETTNFTYFSFSDGGKKVNIEPDKNTWDLEFTNRQHYFSNLPLPFVLSQCVSNIYNGVRVAESNDNNFANITLKDTANYTFTSYADEIGYDWKIRNSQDNSFEIDPNKSYILRTKIGWYFKIRFIDFYNAQGEKGYPKFEIQKL